LDSLEHKNNNEIKDQSIAPAENLEETREIGTISLSTYWKYIGSGGGYFFTSLFVISYVIATAFQQGCNYWLSLWTEKETRASSATYNDLEHNVNYNETGNMSLNYETDFKIGNVYIYSGLMGGFAISIAMSTIQFFHICTKSSKILHQNMFKAIVRSPMSFFDRNPTGMYTFK